MLNIFKVEITGELLGQILVVLQQEWSKQHDVSPVSVKDSEATPAVPAEDEVCHWCSQQQEALFVLELLQSLTGASCLVMWQLDTTDCR